jgi:hypothetical protein
MAFQLSPGVNVTEKDLTTIVPSVASTNAGFVGLFNWGPCNKRILVDSENNLVQLFGTPDDGNAEWWFSAANFLGYGNNLQVVRSKVGGMVNANPLSYTMGGSTASTANCLIENDDKVEFADVTLLGAFTARYPGAIGNSLQVQICGSATANSTGGYTAAGVQFSDWDYGDQFDRVPSTTEYVSNLGGANDEFHLVVIDKGGLFSGTPGTVLERFQNLSVLPTVTDTLGNSVCYYDKINRESKYIFALPKDTTTSFSDIFIGGTGAWSSATDNWQYDQSAAGGLSSSAATNVTNASFGVGVFDLSSGNNGDTALLNNYTHIALGQDPDDDPEGYYLFQDSDTVDVNLIIGGPEKDFTPNADLTYEETGLVGPAIKDIVDARKDCVAFLSVPNKNPNDTDANKMNRAIQYRNNIGSSSYCVIDSGYKYMYDVYNDTYRWVPLNGDIAGLCARSDANFDPWFSPAGFNRGQIRGVVKLAFQPRQSTRDTLYKNNINPVVTFSGEGTVLYGDKTALTKSSAFDRINVRRLFIVLEKAISTAAKYSLFEFNDAFTRAQFRSLIEPFLRDVQARRGIFDFKVVCDEKNNTPEVIDSNRFVADIYIKPNRSINFIQLNFVATKTGVNFNEFGA